MNIKAKNVYFDLGFREPPDDIVTPGIVTGGLRIKIDDYILTKYNTDKYQNKREKYNHKGEVIQNIYEDKKAEFIGDYTSNNIFKILDIALEIKKEDGRFSEKVMDITGSHDLLIFSYLDAEYIRIAFQASNPDQELQPPLESKMGFAVETDSIYRETLDVTDQYLTYVRQCYDVDNSEHDQTIINKRDELDRLIKK